MFKMHSYGFYTCATIRSDLWHLYITFPMHRTSGTMIIWFTRKKKKKVLKIEKIGKREKIWENLKTEKYVKAGFEPATYKKKTFWEYRPEQRRRASFGVRRPARGHGSPRRTLSRLFLAFYRVSDRFRFFKISHAQQQPWAGCHHLKNR